jgi:hypothetical protein
MGYKMKRKPEHHEAGEICNLPVCKWDKELAEGMMFKYTGTCDIDTEHDTWGACDGKIVYGPDGGTPTWKLEPVPVTTIPTPSDSL